MSILTLVLLLSTGGSRILAQAEPAETRIALLRDSDSALPFTLADDLPQQQPPNSGLDGAPVEKTTKQQQQEDFSKPRAKDDGLDLNFGAHARFTVPFGAADRSYATYYGGYYVVDHYLSWADFFNPGWGFEVEADVFLSDKPGRRRSPGFNYGIALLAQTDQYYGTKSSDGHGDTLSMGDMTTGTLQIGGRMMQVLSDEFFYGGLIAIGAVHYSAVEGTFTGPFTTFQDKILRDTWTFASTFRADGGYRLGPVALVAGLGFRIMAPPSEGPHMALNSGAFWTFDIDVGVEIGF
jgi:hypothetical protein